MVAVVVSLREKQNQSERVRERACACVLERLDSKERVHLVGDFSKKWDHFSSSRFYPRRCKTSSVGQSAGLSVPRSSVQFRQKLQKPRTQVYMELRYKDPQAKVLNYCFK